MNANRFILKCVGWFLLGIAFGIGAALAMWPTKKYRISESVAPSGPRLATTVITGAVIRIEGFDCHVASDGTNIVISSQPIRLNTPPSAQRAVASPTNWWTNTSLRSAMTYSNGATRCVKCGYSDADAPTNQWPDAEISRDRFGAMLDNEAERRQHAFHSNRHRALHPELKP